MTYSETHVRNVKINMLDILTQLVEEAPTIQNETVDLILHQFRKKNKVIWMHEGAEL